MACLTVVPEDEGFGRAVFYGYLPPRKEREFEFDYLVIWDGQEQQEGPIVAENRLDRPLVRP